MTVVDDMRKEQEELWRIVYSMSEGQAEKMSSLTRTFDGKIREIETLLSDLTDKISSKIAAIEQALEQVPDMETKLSTLQSAVSQVASDMSKYENTMAAIKESIPKLLASHDTKVIERLKAFSAEVKDILKSK
jgi:cell division protein ZapA (FtsZ GTPase activity inhibitor)